MREHATVDSKGVIVLLLIAASIVAVSCGGTEPSAPDLTASILSLEFTGDYSSGCEVTASWTHCPEGSFDSYILYRSETSDISSSPDSAQVLGIFTDPNASMYVDNDIDWATKYYYALQTSDADNNTVWSNEDSLTTPLPLPEGMEFVTIPSGSFQMGSPESDPDSYDNERPVHTVTFDYSFEMMTTEVTQGMWEEVMGSTPASDFGVGLNYPVYYVSWYDCLEFTDQLNLLDTEYEYRLPSEAEWEYACRAGTTTPYYWGDTLSYIQIDQYAWYDGNSGGTTHPVAQKLPNGWGLYDMSGNVLEWCEDWYHTSYSGAPTDGSPWVSPSSLNRVLRGGGWGSSAGYCRSADRNPGGPGGSSYIVGFRLVRSER
jgi:formylglycine-generating enzyme required for sulfatase activity